MSKIKDHTQESDITWGSEEKSWWSRRSKLERRLLMSLIVAVVLVVGFLLYNFVNTPEVSVVAESCITPGCLTAASQIITHIDPDVDPCDDFFKFACGRFIKQTHGDIKATSIHNAEDQVERQLTEILKEPVNDDDHPMIKLQKDLLQGCMNETTIEEESVKIVHDIMRHLKGWPVVVGYRWKERLFDWKKMTYKLRRLGLPHKMMMNFIVLPFNLEKNLLYIKEPFVEEIKEEHKDMYKKYMTDVAVSFGAERSRAVIEMEKVLDFMERLQKVTEKNEFWRTENNDTEKNFTAELFSRKYKIEEFTEYDDDIDWLDFINKLLYPAANMSKDDSVIFPRTQYLDAFFSLINKTPKRIQANYMIWSVINTVTPFLSKEVKQLQNDYRCLTQAKPVPTDRFDYCRSMVSMSFAPSPLSVLYVRRYLPAEKKEKVQELFTNIKSQFGSILKETSWMDDETKENAIEKLESMTEVIGAPGDYFDDSIFDKFQNVHQNEDPSEDGFISRYLNHMKLLEDYIFSRVNKPINESDDEREYYNYITKVNAMYSPLDNTMILPAGILQGIFYNENRPMYLNYGAIGSIIGHELTHGFCKDASRYNQYGKEESIWTEETEKNYDEVKECIIRDAEEFDVEDTEQRINGTLTLEENIADFTGIKVAYGAYKNWVEENGEEPQLPGIDYTSYQLFWISAISYECFKLSGEKLEKGLEHDRHANNVFRATAPMRNNEDFANDFNCPVDSNMNPSNKCQVF